MKQKKIIEQNNFVNNSLHIIGQQLDCIEEKVGKPTSSKPEKPLIDLPSQRKKLSLKTSQAKTIEKVEQMFFDLQKIKTKQNTTSTSTANAISKKREEVFFFFFPKDSYSDSSSFALDSEKSKTFDKPIFELPKV